MFIQNNVKRMKYDSTLLIPDIHAYIHTYTHTYIHNTYIHI